MNKLFLVGLGPGDPQGMTEAARAALEQQENGLWRVALALDGEEGNRFTLELTLPLQEDAQRLIRRFQTDPQRFYHALESL